MWPVLASRLPRRLQRLKVTDSDAERIASSDFLNASPLPPEIFIISSSGSFSLSLLRRSGNASRCCGAERAGDVKSIQVYWRRPKITLASSDRFTAATTSWIHLLQRLVNISSSCLGPRLHSGRPALATNTSCAGR